LRSFDEINYPSFAAFPMGCAESRTKLVLPRSRVAFVGAIAHNQSLPASSTPTNDDLSLNAESVDRSIWENAKPYLDDSLSDLEAAVPSCKGSNQQAKV
jgi:hypothetical protein